MLTNFDLPSAVRIARVVRAVENLPQQAKPLTFDPVLEQKREEKVFRVCTFTGAWAKQSTKQLMLYNNGSTSNTILATNLLYDIAPAPNTTEPQVCVVGKEADGWYFINVERSKCNDASYRAKELSESAEETSSFDEAVDVDDGPQVLVNDQGCARWFGLTEIEYVSDVQLTPNGLEFSTEKAWVIISSQNGPGRQISTASCPPQGGA